MVSAGVFRSKVRSMISGTCCGACTESTSTESMSLEFTSKESRITVFATTDSNTKESTSAELKRTEFATIA